MKIADQRHEHLDNRSLKTWHHILCDCGVTFSHDPATGAVVSCPSCRKIEEVQGANLPVGAPNPWVAAAV